MSKLPPSLWAATATAAPRCDALSDDEQADVVIIGAGYTGLSAALHLAEAGKTVRVLEAGEPGWGCSGRNGGQLNPGGTRLLPEEIIAKLGPERGGRFIEMAHATCDIVFDLIKRHGIECDALRPGYVQGGHGELGRRYQRQWVRQWGERGVAVELLDRQALAELIGTEAYEIGFLDPRGGNLQPLSYARGLARAAIETGARIHGQTRATSLESKGSDWVVGTAQGSVKARFALLCTNGYTDELWPGLLGMVVPVASFVAASRPLRHDVLRGVLPGRHAVSESSRVIVYYRLDRDGRFVIGGRGNWFDVAQSGDDTHVRGAAARLFPQLADVEWDYHWGGWPAMTVDRLPKLVALAPNAYAGLGYNGRGLGTATMMGKQLAMVVLGEDADLAVEPLEPIRFHGFRQIGISYHLIAGAGLDRWDRRRSASNGPTVP